MRVVIKSSSYRGSFFFKEGNLAVVRKVRHSYKFWLNNSLSYWLVFITVDKISDLDKKGRKDLLWLIFQRVQSTMVETLHFILWKTKKQKGETRHLSSLSLCCLVPHRVSRT